MQLLKIEWLKLKKYPSFWWMLGITALTYPLINLMFYSLFQNVISKKDMAGAIAKSVLGNPFAFPETWHSVAYFSSFFVMVPAILVIMIITNEYQYKTSRQNIIDGWSRDQFMISKLLDVAIITGIVTLMYVITAAVYGFTVKEDAVIGSWSENIKYIPLFMLQTFAQLTLAFLLGFLVKKAFIALGIFIFYYLIIENVIVGYLRKQDISARRFLPFEISDRLIPDPKFFGKFNEEAYNKTLSQINEHIVYTIVLTSFVWWLCFYLYKKKDI
ncbi:ABC transporter permease [Chitinophagaceae bacterium LWZ2-11]